MGSSWICGPLVAAHSICSVYHTNAWRYGLDLRNPVKLIDEGLLLGFNMYIVEPLRKATKAMTPKFTEIRQLDTGLLIPQGNFSFDTSWINLDWLCDIYQILSIFDLIESCMHEHPSFSVLILGYNPHNHDCMPSNTTSNFTSGKTWRFMQQFDTLGNQTLSRLKNRVYIRKVDDLHFLYERTSPESL